MEYYLPCTSYMHYYVKMQLIIYSPRGFLCIFLMVYFDELIVLKFINPIYHFLWFVLRSMKYFYYSKVTKKPSMFSSQK